MLSDGQLVHADLKKEHCKNCQMVRHVSPPSQEGLDRIYKENYTLYARPPGDNFEAQRQLRYVEWVLSITGQKPGQSLFEIGAGNGSFLLQLRNLTPTWTLRGLEPSSVAAEFANHAGFNIHTSTLDEVDKSLINADIVLAINVLEHTENPVDFLRQAASITKNTGRVLIICPDGERPSSELLIYDHVHSFTANAFHNIANEAGLSIEQRIIAPQSIGPFQAFLLCPTKREIEYQPDNLSSPDLYNQRLHFFTAWHNLDDALFQRARQSDEKIWAFGCGENAQILRTYAPKTWGLVSGITADLTGEFDGVAIQQYRPANKVHGRTLLLAVRPEIQNAVAKRLQLDGHRTIQWDDLMQDI
jgi:2-polyprenyl-3-methyl-5-hydroxy-6-metoxy-1,4-benzoquinol methylase